MRWTGAIPLASFMFDAGQWITPVPVSASSSISRSSTWTPWATKSLGLEEPVLGGVLERPLAVVVDDRCDLGFGLVGVIVDRHAPPLERRGRTPRGTRSRRSSTSGA